MLTAQEAALVSQDYSKMLASQEAGNITLNYSCYDLTLPADVDEIYDHDERVSVAHDPVTVRAIVKIITERNLRLLQSGFVEVGDSVIYLPITLDLSNPAGDFEAEVVPNSLTFVDWAGTIWFPKLQHIGNLNVYLGFLIGNRMIGQAVACSLKRPT
jgi:hypothetical protein